MSLSDTVTIPRRAFLKLFSGAIFSHRVETAMRHLLPPSFALTSGNTPKETKQKPSPITLDDIKHAEKVLGLSFTPEERKLMYEDLVEYLKQYDEMRAYPLENSDPPAFRYEPSLPEKPTFPDVSSLIHETHMSTETFRKKNKDLLFFTLEELSHLIRSGDITPTELTELYLERIKKYDSVLKAVITLTEDRAFAEAEQCEKELKKNQYRGPLHGIPYGLKDLFAIKGYPTTWGAMPYKDQSFDYDATVAQKLKESGALLIAKTSVGALAWGDVWYGGKTKNPWDIKQGSSGSSAGSAAGTAAGFFGFGIGTETWGSILSPATRCGVTGLRPTFGRVSRWGCMALSWTMDKVGPLCRSVIDCGLVLQAIIGTDEKDPDTTNRPFHLIRRNNLKGFRIGYFPALFEEKRKNIVWMENDRDVLKVLKELGAELIEMTLPDIPVEPLSIILTAEAGTAFDELMRSNSDDLMVRQERHAWPNVFRHAHFIPAVEYIRANRIRKKLLHEFNTLFHSVHALCHPTYGGDILLLTNLTGHPQICFPNGFDDKGHPTSITFTAPLYLESILIAIGSAYQSVTNFHLQYPPLEKFFESS